MTINGRPGVYFFSLDAESSMAVAAARSMLHLPYFTAQMQVSSDGQQVHYASRRTGRRRGAGRICRAVSARRPAV